VYRHNDLDHLEALLVDCPASSRKLVITDSLFSMDGAYCLSSRIYRIRYL
jgi:8-amino-7-oxononanoate synthase